MEKPKWGKILIVVLIGLLTLVIVLCIWYYFAIYVPVVRHLSANQAYFDSVYSLYQEHALRESTTIPAILNHF